MGNVISEQLAMFLRSILLGGLLALVYDLLRTLRKLGGKFLSALLDGIYCLLTGASLFFFVMAGGGELRLFFLFGALGGAVLFFCLLSRLLLPVWDFWLQIFLSPARLLRSVWKKCVQTLKKIFSRVKVWVTIVYVRWRGILRTLRKKGDDGMDRTALPRKKLKKKSNRGKRHSSKLTLLFLTFLLALLGVQVCNLFHQLQTAAEEEKIHAARLADLQETNQRLKDDIANREDIGLIEDKARDELGMIAPGEKIFRFSK